MQDWLGVGRISSGELWSLFFALAATIMQVSCCAWSRLADAGNAAVSEMGPVHQSSQLVYAGCMYGDVLNFSCFSRMTLSHRQFFSANPAMLTASAC